MLKTNPLNRLFFKLLLGFWVCSSLIIGLFLALPLIQQRLDQASIPPDLNQLLAPIVERIKADPSILNNNKMLSRMHRHHDREGNRLRVFITNEQGLVINSRHVPRAFRRFQLMAEEANQPISHQFREEFIFGPQTFDIDGQIYHVFGRIINQHPRPWFFFFEENKLFMILLATLLSGLTCGMLAWHFGKPLRSLKQAAQALSSGDLSSRVDRATSTRKDEMGELAIAFNSMADSVETMITNQHRLMGDISHELRTPLTRLQLSLALARQKGQHSTELERIDYEAHQLENLISELLTLSKATLGNTDTLMLTELTETLSQVLDDAEFEAEQQGKTLHVGIDETIHLAHFPKLLARAIENILRNAIKYAHSDIHIICEQTKLGTRIVISDDGLGIEDKELEAIFTPFYRPDSSRERSTGGWGLGLAIAQAAVLAHKGTISASNKMPHGLAVEIYIPILG